MYVSNLKYVQHPRMDASKASIRLGGNKKKTTRLKVPNDIYKMSGTPDRRLKSSIKTNIQKKSIIVKDNKARSREVIPKNLLRRVGLLASRCSSFFSSSLIFLPLRNYYIKSIRKDNGKLLITNYESRAGVR